MAAASLTINEVREKAIDFTQSYIDLGLSFSLKKKEVKKDNWRFLKPFSNDVWMMIVISTFAVGLYITFMDKLSPYGWHGRFQQEDHDWVRCRRTEWERKKYRKMRRRALAEMGLTNALWFAISSLLLQGGETYPRSLSARTTIVLWWMGIIIFEATYTANLAAFLTAQRLDTQINSVEQLAAQTKVHYGVDQKGAIYSYFSDSQLPMFKGMFAFMNKKNTYVSDLAQGLDLALNGDYAIIYDSAVLDYAVQRSQYCGLRTIQKVFGKLGYGFGLQKNSPYSSELSIHILQMKERGLRDEMSNKWYKGASECVVSEDEADANENSNQIGVRHMLGVFYVVYATLTLGVLVIPIEWFYASLANVDPSNPEKPDTFTESVIDRWTRMTGDIGHAMRPHFMAKKLKSNKFPRLSIIHNMSREDFDKLMKMHQAAYIARVASASEARRNSNSRKSLNSVHPEQNNHNLAVVDF